MGLTLSPHPTRLTRLVRYYPSRGLTNSFTKQNDPPSGNCFSPWRVIVCYSGDSTKKTPECPTEFAMRCASAKAQPEMPLGPKKNTNLVFFFPVQTWKLSVGQFGNVQQTTCAMVKTWCMALWCIMGYGLEPSIPQNPGAGQSPFLDDHPHSIILTWE